MFKDRKKVEAAKFDMFAYDFPFIDGFQVKAMRLALFLYVARRQINKAGTQLRSVGFTDTLLPL